jgi:hypothetical protein
VLSIGDWILELGDQMAKGTIMLVGPQQDPDPRLRYHPRVMMPGPVSFESLPMLAHRAAVLIMPYADLEVTRAMQPLKLKEYLATLRPVVATSLPAVRLWGDCLEAVSTKDRFVSKALALLNDNSEIDFLRADQVRARLRTESWRSKAAQFQTWLAG